MRGLIDDILLMAMEGYGGLWEVYYEAEARHLELTKADLIELVKKAILDQVDWGWVQLFWCQEPTEDLTPIEPGDAPKVLSENEYWEPPETDSVTIRFFVTEEGEKEFFSRYHE